MEWWGYNLMAVGLRKNRRREKGVMSINNSLRSAVSLAKKIRS